MKLLKSRWAFPLCMVLLLVPVVLVSWAPSVARPQGTGAVGTFQGNTGTGTVTATTEMKNMGTSTALGLSGTNLSRYVTDIALSNGATSQTIQLVSSATTGNDCATAPVLIGTPITLEVNHGMSKPYRTALKIAANSALCCKPSGSTAFSCEVEGYVAP